MYVTGRGAWPGPSEVWVLSNRPLRRGGHTSMSSASLRSVKEVNLDSNDVLRWFPFQPA